MRQAAERVNEYVLQSEHMKLLKDTVESGNAALVGQIAAFTSQQKIPHTCDEPREALGNPTGRCANYSRRGKTRRCRLVLPRWFIRCVWDFTIHGSNHVWTVQLQPVNLRPFYTDAFEPVRNGDVIAVCKLLEQGHLCVNDRAVYWDSTTSVSLLEVLFTYDHVVYPSRPADA